MPHSQPSRAKPHARGRLMFPEDVRVDIFGGHRTSWWVRRNFLPDKKIRLGHSTVAWHEQDVFEWLDGLRGA